ncbi:hypothetical protein [Streptomyces sp. SID14515]|uniref:hypothetical protein n=1 Tax=Streptomyces sp. SID14515 TaxID=2706074 RepID=UPI0013C89CEC|nr:hypothetical protein [Streptomyces sp. SID14515]NEB42287.1 hypothetical protein [Streptomyces sp. SID14515]
MNTNNNVTDSTADTVIQAGTTGPINIDTSTQNNAPTFSGNNTGVTVINGDMAGEINQTFNR